MPPKRATTDGISKPRRLRSIIAFAAELEAQLSDYDNLKHTEALIKRLEDHIDTLRGSTLRGHRAAQDNDDLDKHGTALWNLATRLRRDATDANGTLQDQIVLLCTRVFAFQLLELSQPDRVAPSEILRMLKLALKTAQTCLEEAANPSFSELALQRARDAIQTLRTATSDSSHNDGAGNYETYEMEYLTLRIVWSWREDKIDLAEHLYGQVEKLDSHLAVDPHAAEHLAESLYELGSGMMAKQELALAEKWLERANRVISIPELDQLTREATELRLTILHALVKANMSAHTPEGLEKARNTVDYIESEVGRNKLLVLLLRLELINARPDEVLDCDAFADILRRMVHSITSDTNLKLWIHHVRKLHAKAPGLSCCLIDDLLASLMRSQVDRDDWIEKIALTRIWMTTGQRDSVELVTATQESLAKLEKPLGVDATIAAHILIWKSVGAAYTQGHFDLANAWCQLALDPVFQLAGPNTVAKLQRKMLLCAISRNDMDSARSVFYSMADNTQSDPLTRYLMYKVAIRSSDRPLAAECLAVVAAAGHQDLLYACVVESNHSADRMCAVDAMKILQQKHDHDSSSPVHLPALFRCLIRLLDQALKAENADEQERRVLVQDLCDVFDGVLTSIERDHSAGNAKAFDFNELDWFCRNAYNLGMAGSASWDLRHVVQILTACTGIIAKVPQADLPADTATEMMLKSLFSNFVIATCLVALARHEDNTEQQLQYYLIMRRHVAAFDSELQQYVQPLDEDCRRDMLLRLSRLLIFDFEGAVALKQWEQLDGIARRAGSCENVVAFQAMGDCILRSGAPPEFLFAALRVVINELSVLQRCDFGRLAKYIRCLFQVMLPVSDERALQLLQETARMSEEASSFKAPVEEARWPAAELEWFVITAHNHAVDLWGGGQDDASRAWEAQAVELSHFCADGGKLERVIKEHYSKLSTMN